VDFVIIKTMSVKETRIAKLAKDLLEATLLETVIIVPFGIKKIVISEDPVTGQFSLHTLNRDKELNVTRGFLDFESSFNQAITIAENAGISKNDIECDTVTYLMR
jgi:hypothetical protein